MEELDLPKGTIYIYIKRLCLYEWIWWSKRKQIHRMGKTKDLDIFGGATKIKKLRMIVN